METLHLPENITIIVITNKLQCDYYVNLILQIPQGSFAVWGFDIEWTVDFKKGKQKPAALLQLCRNNVILLFHITKHGWQPSLNTFLQSSRVFKVGVNIIGDIHKLERDFQSLAYASCRGAVDIRTLAHYLGLPAQASLASLCSVYLRKVLPKESSVRTNSWDKPLTNDQLQYAALDAYASYQIFTAVVKQGLSLNQRNLDSISTSTTENETERWVLNSLQYASLYRDKVAIAMSCSNSLTSKSNEVIPKYSNGNVVLPPLSANQSAILESLECNILSKLLFFLGKFQIVEQVQKPAYIAPCIHDTYLLWSQTFAAMEPTALMHLHHSADSSITPSTLSPIFDIARKRGIEVQTAVEYIAKAIDAGLRYRQFWLNVCPRIIFAVVTAIIFKGKCNIGEIYEDSEVGNEKTNCNDTEPVFRVTPQTAAKNGSFKSVPVPIVTSVHCLILSILKDQEAMKLPCDLNIKKFCTNLGKECTSNICGNIDMPPPKKHRTFAMIECSVPTTTNYGEGQTALGEESVIPDNHFAFQGCKCVFEPWCVRLVTAHINRVLGAEWKEMLCSSTISPSKYDGETAFSNQTINSSASSFVLMPTSDSAPNNVEFNLSSYLA